MYRKDRAEVVSKFKKVIDEYKDEIRTQKDFVRKYEEYFNKNISQSTVSRTFKYAGIRINPSTGRYSYDIPKSYYEQSKISLNFILSQHVDEIKFSKSNNVHIHIEAGCEQYVAHSIFDYLDDKNIINAIGINNLILNLNKTKECNNLKELLKEIKKEIDNNKSK